MLHVTAVLTARPDQRALVLAEVEKLRPIVQAEPGCIAWTACVDIAGGPDDLRRLGPDGVAIVERWDSMAALEAHSSSVHMADWRARIASLLLSRDVWVLQSA